MQLVQKYHRQIKKVSFLINVLILLFIKFMFHELQVQQRRPVQLLTAS